MATRFIHRGPEIPEGVANAVGFGVNEDGGLALHKGSTTYGEELIPVGRVINAAASFTLTEDDNGALILANSTTSVVATLPATKAGLKFSMAVVQLTTTGGHSFSPAAADKIYGAGFSTTTDDKDVICAAATDRVGDFIRLEADGLNGWIVTASTGTWAQEA